MRKKITISLLLAVVSLATLFGAGVSLTPSQASAQEDMVLQVSYPSWWEDWFLDLKADFEEQNEGVEVELIPLFDDVTTKQTMMMQSPETAPDVAVEDTYIINSDVNAGYLASMQAMVDGWEDWANFEETVKQGVMAENGEIYGVPFSTDVQGLWYNREIFKEAGLEEDFAPANWEDVLTAARAIKDSG